MPQCGCVLRKPKAGLGVGESSCDKDHWTTLDHTGMAYHAASQQPMVTLYYGRPECDAVFFKVWTVTEYYGPPQCDAVSLTGWIVTAYTQGPAMVSLPGCRKNQLLGMRLRMWTEGSHGLR